MSIKPLFYGQWQLELREPVAGNISDYISSKVASQLASKVPSKTKGSIRGTRRTVQWVLKHFACCKCSNEESHNMTDSNVTAPEMLYRAALLANMARKLPPPKKVHQKSKILVIGLQDDTFTDSHMYKPLRRTLEKHAELQVATSSEECRNMLIHFRPAAVLAVDAGLALSPCIRSMCAKYVRRGGRLVFACNFANYMPRDQNIRRFFQTFGLYWTFAGDRKGLAIRSNDECKTRGEIWSILPQNIAYEHTQVLCNVKKEHAPYLVNAQSSVSTLDSAASKHRSGRTSVPKDKIMHNGNGTGDGDIDSDSSQGTQNGTFESAEAVAPEIWSTRVETPIAWAPYKAGFVGAICDNHIQKETISVMFVMLGLVSFKESV